MKQLGVGVCQILSSHDVDRFTGLYDRLPKTDSELTIFQAESRSIKLSPLKGGDPTSVR